MKKLLLVLLCTLMFLMFACSPAEVIVQDVYQFPVKVSTDKQAYENDKINFPDSLWQTPVTSSTGSEYTAYFGKVNGIFLESVPLSGGTLSKVFAYYGMPDGASKKAKVPGIVLVHGGLGTAYAEWVQKWISKGYAAIAIDTEGNIPNAGERGESAGKTASGYGGPINTSFSDVNKPVEEQFMYHASAAAIVANSFLRSLPEVDKNKIGITGISWGGLITSIVTGYDDRFAFSIPIYGCLNLIHSGGSFSPLYLANPKAAIWDDNKALKNSNTPILWLNGANDQFFSLDATTKSFTDSNFAILSIVNGLSHSHTFGWSRPESYKFADSVVKGSAKMIKINIQPDFNNNKVEYFLPNNTTLANVRLYESTDTKPLLNTRWTKTDIDALSTINFTLNSGTNIFYLELEDNDGCITSTNLIMKNN